MLKGLYLNLDRSVARRQHMDAQIQRLGLHWIERQSAVDGSSLTVPDHAVYMNQGAYGCRLSHVQAQLGGADHEFTLILEDDVDISPYMSTTIHMGQLDALAKHDVVFLDAAMMVNFFDTLHHQCNQMMSPTAHWNDDVSTFGLKGVLMNRLQHNYDAVASAYIVTPKGRATLKRLYDQDNRRPTPLHAIDVFFRHKLASGELDAVLLAPFLATVSLPLSEESNIGYAISDGPMKRWLSLLAAFRRLLFAGPSHGINAFAQPWLEHTNGIRTASQLRREVLLSLYAMQLDRQPPELYAT